MKILGISAFYHDSAAAIIIDGKIVAAAQEERFTRKKHDDSFPTNAVRFCLAYSGTNMSELDAVAFYDKPLLKFERLMETYHSFAPKGLPSFITSLPVWLKEKMFLKRLLRESLAEAGDCDASKLKLLFPEHHLSHAASAYYPSAFDEAAILTIDGVGEWATASICHGKGKEISILKELRFPHSIGLLYSAFTYFLGFRVNSGEYKLMGLAPYGDPDSDRTREFRRKIGEIAKLQEDGSVWLDQQYFNYATGLRMVHDKKWEKHFGFARRDSESDLEQRHCDLALAIQQFTEEAVIKLGRTAKELTGSDHLCMAGGVALNCVANGKLLREGIFKDIFIQPAAGDAGGAPGAALAASHLYFDEERPALDGADRMQGSYLGPEFSALEIEQLIRKFDAVATRFEEFDDLAAATAAEIEAGAAIGWCQGRMEFGPRALGARSILGDARNPEMQKKLNLKIKYRESFRPFAPSVLAEDCNSFFELESSPYMLLVEQVQQSRCKTVPADYHQLPVREKLYVLRSDVPAVTHIDFSARVQTVHRETNPRYHRLIEKFKDLTDCGVVVNTSFNVRGEPIVCTPEDAYRCFMRTEMDVLVVGDFLFRKQDQPEWQSTDDWKEEFKLD